ncbi:hypothetical protein RY963_000948 [Stenotrophomonas maltophilia]|nr:hypothetical protein [Stenotrophomonas maltophilia]ELN2592121.1 hypothetical protein [Stenotrophomonas maltophilia]MBH1400007.1 hypothetical protein [Stenotrophomonas maltophilia]
MSRLKKTTAATSLRFTARGSEAHTRYMSNDEVKKLARKDLTKIDQQIAELEAEEIGLMKAMDETISRRHDLERKRAPILEARSVDLSNRYTYTDTRPGIDDRWRQCLWVPTPKHDKFIQNNIGVHYSAKRLAKSWSIPPSLILEYCRRNSIDYAWRVAEWAKAKKETRTMGVRASERHLKTEALRIVNGEERSATAPITRVVRRRSPATERTFKPHLPPAPLD